MKKCINIIKNENGIVFVVQTTTVQTTGELSGLSGCSGDSALRGVRARRRSFPDAGFAAAAVRRAFAFFARSRERRSAVNHSASECPENDPTRTGCTLAYS